MLSLMIDNPDKGLDRLMNQYSGCVFAIVRGKLMQCGSLEDIEECVSDVFIDFYQSITKVDLTKGSIKAYLSVIAKRKAIDRYRSLTRQPALILNDNTDAADSLNDVEDSFTATQERDEMIIGIKSLGKTDATIFIRRYYLGQSTREIAKAMLMKENTVDKHISRGLKKLKSILGGEA
jgi:RNA polymerase sigma-70 factor (ECF subfamily)